MKYAIEDTGKLYLPACTSTRRMGQPRLMFRNQPRLFFAVLYSGPPSASTAPVPRPWDEAPTMRCRGWLWVWLYSRVWSWVWSWVWYIVGGQEEKGGRGGEGEPCGYGFASGPGSSLEVVWPGRGSGSVTLVTIIFFFERFHVCVLLRTGSNQVYLGVESGQSTGHFFFVLDGMFRF